MLRLLQEIGANFSELPFLLGGNNRLGLVQAVGDQIVQLLPVVQLDTEQAQFGFQLLILHELLPGRAASSRVSSNFWRFSINRCAHGRLTVWDWLMIPSSK